MHETNRIWLLMARSLSGEITPSEKEEMEAYIQADPTLQQRFEILQQFWKNEDHAQTNANFYAAQVEKIVKLAQQEDDALIQFEKSVFLQKRKRRVIAFSIAGIAAAFVLFLILRQNNSATSELLVKPQNEISAQYGSRSRVILSDGSTVWLNAGSRLFYNDFNSNHREVTLEGEAFFDVVKINGKPFMVHTYGVDVKVLGTAFNVKSYADEDIFETTLIKGAVEVIKKDGSNSIFLKPNQKITLFRNNEPGNELIVKNTGSNEVEKYVLKENFTLINLDSAIKSKDRVETAWVHNRLIFHGDNFEQLAKKLERWYNVKVTFGDEAVKRLSFYGSFENETIEQGLRFLQTAVYFYYKIQGNEIYISTKKN